MSSIAIFEPNMTVRRAPRDGAHPFCVMANAFLQDKGLSLKAKGLLAYLLTLKDSVWHLSIRGLAAQLKEGISSINAALKELVKNGYISMERNLDEYGRYSKVQYTLTETPFEDGFYPAPEETDEYVAEIAAEEPALLSEELADATENDDYIEAGTATECAVYEVETDENTAELRSAGEENEAEGAIYAEDVYDGESGLMTLKNGLPETAEAQIEEAHEVKKKNPEISGFYAMLLADRESCRSVIEKNVELYGIRYNSDERACVSEMIELMVDVLCSEKDGEVISGERMSKGAIADRFFRINGDHMEAILSTMGSGRTRIRNLRAYMLAVLYNAPATLGKLWLRNMLGGI